jgi:hypothetical protein
LLAQAELQHCHGQRPPLLRRILEGELPQTVDKLINLAEHP